MDALSDLTVEQIDRAKEIIEKTETFYPAIATIRKAALIDPSRITAEQAWELVCERIRRVGFNGGSGDLDPEIKAAINACGGWGELCRSEKPDNMRFRFVKAFNSAREEADRKLLVEGDQAPERMTAELTEGDQTPQRMTAELMEGIKQIGHREELAPAEERASTSLERLREARKEISTMRNEIGRGNGSI